MAATSGITPHGLTFGLGVPAVPPGELHPLAYYRRLIEVAADSGFERLWVGDHALWHRPRYEAFTLLAALAGLGASHGLGLGTSVALAPLRHPLWLAKSAATLAALTQGRFILGLGVGGEYPDEFALLGVDRARRGRLTDEAVAFCRKAWAGQLRQDFSPAPEAGDIPIWIGGRSEAAIRRAGRLGDGYLGLWLDPQRYALALDRVTVERAAAGRAGMATAALVLWSTITNGDQLTTTADLAGHLGAEYSLDPSKFTPYLAAGSAGYVADLISQYEAAGASHIQLQFPSATTLKMVERAGTELIPRFR